MHSEIRQELLSLENRDLVQKWFKKIHGRELNLTRTKEINAAAKQSSEFFRNAEYSNFTVRPLLTFYGVASLSRALILILRRSGGEESLNAGHGLKTVDWPNTLKCDLGSSLLGMGGLRVETCAGLFSDLTAVTDNRISIHVTSSAVDWHLNYEIPNIGNEFSLLDLLERIPDLELDLLSIEKKPKYASVSRMSYSLENGLDSSINASMFENIATTFEEIGFDIRRDGSLYKMVCTSDFFGNNIPLLLHKYVHKVFGSIPDLFIVEPFPNKSNYSEISTTYLISYYLGMLVRYFPTHWTALVQGEKGDLYWPILNRAQHFVETIFPELVIELVHDILKERNNTRKDNE